MLWPTMQILGFSSKFSVGRNMAHLIKMYLKNFNVRSICVQ